MRGDAGAVAAAEAAAARARPAGALHLTGVLQQIHRPGWLWIPKAFTAGALPPLSFVSGTRAAPLRVWWDSTGAKHILKKEFGFEYVSDVNMWIAVL